MNKYESIIIINPNCTDEALKALESKFTGLINENGKVEDVVDMGKRKLAYEIKKNKEGYYELHRYCVKDGYTVVGGANKLHKYFESPFLEAPCK